MITLPYHTIACLFTRLRQGLQCILISHALIVLFTLCGSVLFFSCTTSRPSVVTKKYPAKKLKEDYKIFQGALEESHPGLYWFTPKNEIDKEFAEAYASIKDSMTERQFRTLLLKSITPIRDRKSTRLNSSHLVISYAVFCLKKKKNNIQKQTS